MADERAEVIKVKPPQGELSRSREPTRMTGKHRISGHFGGHNRGTRSIALDLRTEAAREATARLLSKASVFITNVRPGALARLTTRNWPAMAADTFDLPVSEIVATGALCDFIA